MGKDLKYDDSTHRIIFVEKGQGELRKKCNACGKIFCFNANDVIKSEANATSSTIDNVLSITETLFGGGLLTGGIMGMSADNSASKVVDFNKCPHCGSRDLKVLTQNEYNASIEQDNDESKSQVKVDQKKIVSINSNASVDSLLKRTKLFLEDKDWESAAAYCESILDLDAECSQAYVYKLMIDLKVSEQESLASLEKTFYDEQNYQKAIRFADEGLKTLLEGYNATIEGRQLEKEYQEAMNKYSVAETDKEYQYAKSLFDKLGDYKNSKKVVEECNTKIELYKYDQAKKKMQDSTTERGYLLAKELFDALVDYADSKALSETCRKLAEEAHEKEEESRVKETESRRIAEEKRKTEIYDHAISLMNSKDITVLGMAINEFEKIAGWNDANQKKDEVADKIIKLTLKKKRKKVALFILIGAAIVVCVFLVIMLSKLSKETKYQTAIELYNAGNYSESIIAFERLYDYKDSPQYMVDSALGDIEQQIEGGNLLVEEKTLSYVEGNNDYMSAISNVATQHILQLIEQGNVEESLELLKSLSYLEHSDQFILSKALLSYATKDHKNIKYSLIKELYDVFRKLSDYGNPDAEKYCDACIALYMRDDGCFCVSKILENIYGIPEMNGIDKEIKAIADTFEGRKYSAGGSIVYTFIENGVAMDQDGYVRGYLVVGYDEGNIKVLGLSDYDFSDEPENNKLYFADDSFGASEDNPWSDFGLHRIK